MNNGSKILDSKESPGQYQNNIVGTQGIDLSSRILKRMFCTFSLMCLLIGWSSATYAQEKNVHIITRADNDATIANLIKNQPQKVDSSLVYEVVDSLVNQIRAIGYLSSGIDTIIFQDSTAQINLYLGPQFTWSDIAINEKDKAILQGSGINFNKYSGDVLTPNGFATFKTRILKHLSNVGYPFAAVALDSIKIDGKDIQSRLNIQKNDLIVYDSIAITGTATVNKSYLHRYLNIRKARSYRQNDVLQLKTKIRDLTFLEFKADPQITFVNQKAYFDLPLVNKNASKFDFIIGVLPRTENGIRKWTITGDFTGEFVNKLGNGESIALRYRRLRPETQELEASLNYPYLFNMPFGIDGRFELFRNTTNFLDLQSDLGMTYNLARRDVLKVGWSFKSSRLIEIDSTTIINSRRLPEQLDVNVTSGATSFTIDRLNYRLNPSSGILIRIQAEAGQKKIIPNLSIKALQSDAVDFSEAYDSLQLTSFQTSFALDIDYFINVRNWSTIRIANRSAYKYNQNRVYRNEFFRIGGNRLLRGFNEESIFTPFYSVFTAEFRLLLDQLSFISLPFVDYGIIRIEEDGVEEWQRAIGAGIGLNFATKAGIFNIAFAAGSIDGSGFNFGDTKIHFGFVNLF
jgi:outer membrane protein assembly factor BamA